MIQSQIFITGGNEHVRRDLQKRIHQLGLCSTVTLPFVQLLKQHKEHPADLIVCLSLGNGQDGSLDIVTRIRNHKFVVPVILVARHSSEDSILAAFRAGASDYLRLDCPEAELRGRLFFHLKNGANDQQPGLLTSMVGESQVMRQIKTNLGQIAATDSTVLITGETGTGKEIAAEIMQKQSSRHNRPFLRVNCSALPDTLIESELFGYERGAFTGADRPKRGKFELADEGTLFLDEIGDTNLAVQAKLLRVVENQEIYRLGSDHPISLDVRIIAATNQDPEQLFKESRFREDLYYRLNVARVHIPPLRKHKEDIRDLVDHFVGIYNRIFNQRIAGFSEKAMRILHSYEWPGNIRELKNIIESVFINLPEGSEGLIDIPLQIRERLKICDEGCINERSRIVTALMSAKWNKSLAARNLNLSRMTVYRKMSQYNIVEKRNPPR